MRRNRARRKSLPCDVNISLKAKRLDGRRPEYLCGAMCMWKKGRQMDGRTRLAYQRPAAGAVPELALDPADTSCMQDGTQRWTDST